MKKSIILQIAIPVFILGMIISGCSKERIGDLTQNKSVLQDVKNPAPAGKLINPVTYGYLTGTILPLKPPPVIVLYSSGEDITLYTDENGSLGKSRIPTGIYTLVIYPGNTNYGGYTINDLDINENEVTDIGTIILPLLNAVGDEAAGN